MQLLMIFEPTLLWSVHNDHSGNTFAFGNHIFGTVVDCEWIGFYDWLWGANNDLLGVRHYPFVDDHSIEIHVRAMIQQIGAYDYINISEHHIIDIFGSSRPKTCVRSGCEQNFGDNRLFRSVGGVYAMSFGMAHSPTIQMPLKSGISHVWKSFSRRK